GRPRDLLPFPTRRSSDLFQAGARLASLSFRAMMLDRLPLKHDLVDCRGTVLARAGMLISGDAIAEAEKRAPPIPRRLLAETFVRSEEHTSELQSLAYIVC